MIEKTHRGDEIGLTFGVTPPWLYLGVSGVECIDVKLLVPFLVMNRGNIVRPLSHILHGLGE